MARAFAWLTLNRRPQGCHAEVHLLKGKVFQCRLFVLCGHHCNKCEGPPTLTFLVSFRLPMPGFGEWRQNECSAALNTLVSEQPSAIVLSSDLF